MLRTSFLMHIVLLVSCTRFTFYFHTLVSVHLSLIGYSFHLSSSNSWNLKQKYNNSLEICAKSQPMHMNVGWEKERAGQFCDSLYLQSAAHSPQFSNLKEPTYFPYFFLKRQSAAHSSQFSSFRKVTLIF